MAKIIRIKKLNKRIDRYDLQIENNHNFFANGILIHNTSGRFGYVLDDVEFPFPRGLKWMKKLLKFFNQKIPTIRSFNHLHGSRQVVFRDASTPDFYQGDNFRQRMIKDLEGRLHKGEILYFELVGFTESGAAIMPPVDGKTLKQNIPEFGKGLLKIFSEKQPMYYSYGCDPVVTKKTDLYIYRITQVSDDESVIELSWQQVKNRCNELGIKYVPELLPPQIFNGNHRDLQQLVNSKLEGLSVLDSRHIREGIVVRIESYKTFFLKAKSFTFKVLEGMIKDKDDYVDLEEIS